MCSKFIWINCLVFFSFLSLYSQQKSKIFESISPSSSGVTFNNSVKHDLTSKVNLFDFDFFYNGAGVGIGDLNNDGLQDIVFASNQNDNEVYINLGNFKFRKLDNALDSEFKKWSNGVSLVDINKDGFLDIYFSQGGSFEREERMNLLFINQGDLTFKESAEEYGLQDQGISTQSAFVDIDSDGDLDCIVMNESEFYGYDPISFYQKVGVSTDLFWHSSSHLYLNDNGNFVDHTEKSGLLKPTFGLGLRITDFNNDYLPDIYIANDYYIPDAIYINQGDGTFIDKADSLLNQMSFYGMGVDIADINNDGIEDIFVLDMASNDHYRSKTLMRSMNVKNFRLLVNTLRFPHQYMYNSVQLGSNNGKYRNVAQMSGMSSSDWSWSVLLNDFDHNGNKDVHITNGYRRYALDNDFQNEVFKTRQQYGGQVPIQIKEELYQKMPTEKLSNQFYSNQGHLKYVETTTDWSDEPPGYSNGAAVADLDNDGDLDVVVNNMDAPATILKNLTVDENMGSYIILKAPKHEHNFSVDLFHNGVMQSIRPARVRGYMSSSEPIAHFGLGSDNSVDSIIVKWSDKTTSKFYDIAANTILSINKDKSVLNHISHVNKAKKLYSQMPAEKIGLSFKHRENDYDDYNLEILLPFAQSTWGPAIKKFDYNNDGLDDVMFLGASGQPNELYVQTAQSWKKVEDPLFVEDAGYEDMDVCFFDLNGDGWSDLYFNTGGNEFPENSDFYVDRVYINNKGKGFLREDIDILKTIKFSGSATKKIDFDSDGDDDLLVANRIVPQKYPKHGQTYLLENKNGQLIDVSSSRIPEFSDFGMVNDIEIVDMNEDGKPDILACGEWTEIGYFQNQGDHFIKKPILKDGNLTLRGLWFEIISSDINSDGIQDYIFGNLGLNSKYKATLKKPLKVYGGDFDNNGTWDLVLSKKYKDEYVPLRGKECSTQQMPFLAEKFPTYDLFASSSISDVYGEELNKSYEKEINTLSHYAMISKNSGFDWVELDTEMQSAPVLCGFSLDSGDVVLAGNIYDCEVETPRLDMGQGFILNWDEEKIRSKPTADLGMNLDGNIKSLLTIYHKGLDKHFVIAGENNGNLKIFESNE